MSSSAVAIKWVEPDDKGGSVKSSVLLIKYGDAVVGIVIKVWLWMLKMRNLSAPDRCYNHVDSLLAIRVFFSLYNTKYTL